MSSTTESSMASFRLDDKVALVTGASSGLGARFSKVLTEAGASVVLAARRIDRLRQLADQLPRALAVQCDVTDETSLTNLVESSLRSFGRIDVLVNNAGVSQAVPAEDESLADFRETIEINLVSAFAVSQLVGRHMLERKSGSIVNVASILGLVGAGRVPLASYVASKGGVILLTRELALQWARRGVRVNAIAPGWFPSEMTTDMLASESGRRWIEREAPMGRPGEEHELDGALLFLASNASSYVTGQVLAVDGGWTAK
jgi:NAD(P)-dependent dehydrogenase (short-subunit alcohol dehydrogenase family)